jgi:hypothetical protein
MDVRSDTVVVSLCAVFLVTAVVIWWSWYSYRRKFPSWEDLHRNGVGWVNTFDGQETFIRFDKVKGTEIEVPRHEMFFARRDIVRMRRAGLVPRITYFGDDGEVISQEVVKSFQFQNRLRRYSKEFDKIWEDTGQKPWIQSAELRALSPFTNFKETYPAVLAADAKPYRVSHAVQA